MEKEKIGKISGKKYEREVSGNVYTQFQFSVPKEIREELPEELELEVYKNGEDIVFTTDNQLIIKGGLKEKREKLRKEVKKLESKKAPKSMELSVIYRLLTGSSIRGKKQKKFKAIKEAIEDLEDLFS